MEKLTDELLDLVETGKEYGLIVVFEEEVELSTTAKEALERSKAPLLRAGTNILYRVHRTMGISHNRAMAMIALAHYFSHSPYEPEDVTKKDYLKLVRLLEAMHKRV